MHITQALLLASLTLAYAFPDPARATTITIADDETNVTIEAADVTRRGDVVVGTLINRSPDEVRDIRLNVDIPFLWKNELAPGADSPGRSVVLTVAGPIAPHGKVAFELRPSPPLPERTDGRFGDPKVHVMGYSHVAAR